MDAATLAKSIADYDSKRVTSEQATNDALAQYGIPEIRKNVAGLRTTVTNTQNALNAVDPSVTGRTQGSLVTEAQRQRQVANERAPIAQQLDSQGRMLGDSERNLGELTTQANIVAANRVNDWQTGRQALQSQYETTYQREQNALAQQVAAEQARRAQANADREYALQKQAAASRASGGSSTPSAAQVKGAIQQGLSSVRGKDGYVSPQDYAKGLKAWLEAGLPRDQYNKQFNSFRNPKNAYYDYAVKQAGL